MDMHEFYERYRFPKDKREVYSEVIDAGVDPKMKEIVELLNEFGLETYNSCSGILETHFNDDFFSVPYSDREAIWFINPYLTVDGCIILDDGVVDDKRFYHLVMALCKQVHYTKYDGSEYSADWIIDHRDGIYEIKLSGTCFRMLLSQVDSYEMFDEILIGHLSLLEYTLREFVEDPSREVWDDIVVYDDGEIIVQ